MLISINGNIIEVPVGASKDEISELLKDTVTQEAFNTYVSSISELIESKVSKEEGKQLSSNDYTTADKDKLDSLQNYSFGATLARDPETGVINVAFIDWSKVQNVPEFALKSDINGLYRYKGSVPTYDDLPMGDLEVGWTYDVQDTGKNYAWNGTGWDDLGGVFKVDLPSKAVTKAYYDSLTDDEKNADVLWIVTGDTPAEGDVIPKGIVTAFSGARTAIPNGWYLCDGQNGTPDLSSRFIIGASDEYPVGTKGGSDTIELSINEINGVMVTSDYNSGSMFSGGENAVIPVENDDDPTQPLASSASYLPPYYALAWIMKGEADLGEELVTALYYKGVRITKMGATPAVSVGAVYTAGDGIDISLDNEISVTAPVKTILTQQEYNALPEDERDKGFYIVDDGMGPTYDMLRMREIYSLHEQIIGTWVDGKPIYRICIPFNTLFTFAGGYVNIDVTSLNIDNLVNIHGTHIISAGSLKGTVAIINDGWVMLGINSTTKKLVGRESYSSESVTISGTAVLEYTKSSDVATIDASYLSISTLEEMGDFPDDTL